jgi:endonuclease/exonuclease/phosphatase family metal-dependent hydrolase
MVKYSGLPVYHRTTRLTARAVQAILVHRDIVHHSVPVPCLTHFVATAIQVTLAGKPLKILAAHLSLSRLSGRIAGLHTGDLNSKHVDGNLRLSTI